MHIPSIVIGERRIGPDAPVFIIGEAGVNWNGDLDVARRMVDVAAEAGVDAVKFQTFRAGEVAGRSAPKAPYQLRTTDEAESQHEMLRRLELSPQGHRDLQRHCRSRGVAFVSTPFGEESADLLEHLGVPLFKISSGDVTNIPFLQHVARKGRPMLLSTGMCYLSEVGEAVTAIRHAGGEHLVLLHCVSAYPADPADANLRAIRTLRRAFQLPVGYSDHTLGVDVALAAVALGACVVEKHFTVDRSLPGPDQRASLEPAELGALVSGIRSVERALGTGIKEPCPSEADNRLVVRRSLAAAADLPQGAVLTARMLTAIRPATGLAPGLMPHVIGRRLKRPLARGDLIAWSDLE